MKFTFDAALVDVSSSVIVVGSVAPLFFKR
jgi:hypothetical protein